MATVMDVSVVGWVRYRTRLASRVRNAAGEFVVLRCLAAAGLVDRR
jgi:hypothetical protein